MEVTDIKTTGIVREIDDFGRVVPPAEWRRMNGIENGSKVEMSIMGECLVLRKFTPGCSLCHRESKTLVSYRGFNICKKCIAEIKTLE